jgi:hypothetical protein
MFSNEEDLLKLRIIEGLNFVEKFIIVEAKQTHTGLNKPLYSDRMKDFFETYKNKIIHCIVEKFPLNINNYPKGVVNSILKDRKDCRDNKELFNNRLREYYQRSIIGNYAVRCKGSDIFLVSDVDEIPNYNKLAYDISINNNNILNEQINYTMPTYVFNIHYRLDWYNPIAAFTCPARLLNPDNTNIMRFHSLKKNLNGYFYHLNCFHKPEGLIIKFKCSCELTYEENTNNLIEGEVFKDMRKDILKRILSGSYSDTKMEYRNHEMPKNINMLPRFFLLNKEEIDMYLKKIDDPNLDFENTYNEIINL